MLYLLTDLRRNSFKISVRMCREKAAAENKKLRAAGKFERWLSADLSRQNRKVVCAAILENQKVFNRQRKIAE